MTATLMEVLANVSAEKIAKCAHTDTHPSVVYPGKEVCDECLLLIWPGNDPRVPDTGFAQTPLDVNADFGGAVYGDPDYYDGWPDD